MQGCDTGSDMGTGQPQTLSLTAQCLSLSFTDQSQTSLQPVTNIKAKSRGITRKTTSYTKWPKTPDRSQSFGSPNASPSSPFTHLQGKSKYISNLSLSRSNSPLGQARPQRSIRQLVSEWPHTQDSSTDGRWDPGRLLMALPHLPALFCSYIAHLPPTGPSPVLRSIRILEIDMAIQSQFCAASNACR